MLVRFSNTVFRIIKKSYPQFEWKCIKFGLNIHNLGMKCILIPAITLVLSSDPQISRFTRVYPWKFSHKPKLSSIAVVQMVAKQELRKSGTGPAIVTILSGPQEKDSDDDDLTTTGPIKSKHQLTKIVNDVVLTATIRTFFYTVCRFQNIWKISQDVLEQKQIPDRFVEFNVCFSSNSGTRSTSGGWGSCMLSHTHKLSLEARLTMLLPWIGVNMSNII